ncbi:MAG TPA: zinc-ribbon domain containing protein [Candidatus Eremiobacteraceae bacterium]|nr:zinc-ribbon domain containing protein [Candidatus Eremiobacteraceae bacterium]
MLYIDKTLTCSDCNAQFVFTSGEQDFHAQKGFTNAPGRCPACREARKAQRGNGGGQTNQRGGNGRFDDRPRREMFRATCSDCGGVAELPFQPSGDRPVYCRDCFSKHRA